MSGEEPAGLSSQQLLFQDDPSLRFARVGGDPGPKPRELGAPSYIRDRYFAPQGAEFRRSLYPDGPDLREPRWNGGSDTPSGGDATDGNEDDDDDDDDEDVHAGRKVAAKDAKSTQPMNNARASSTEIHHHQGRMGNYANTVTIAEPDGELFYSQYLRGSEASESRQKDVPVENTCGFSGRKDVAFQSDSGEPLRAILSDPVTGALMDDAMILPCGHSFGSGGMQHVIGTKACPTCSQSVSEESILPNHSLRAAVQAFRREEDVLFNRSLKRRRDRVEQDMNSYAYSLMDLSRSSRGVQFPFAVTDRVIIKGNKRTPQRFVGREAIVTTQCLNGWYVVKTLDNAESVKLQYRSLAKVTNDSSSKLSSGKMAPNWLHS
ncbi:U-box domain-containing protein 62-like isoform X1 [Punica granatum]|uniref:U-box domain-containing protein 62-like isoform X1 n=1 Tax=Punica granatum TaxID=22663 RepID=A0A6P8BSD0_PUNGR|nr:U-box domain-containing protein 62-like isoform X1 [Punica granatum]